MQRSLVRTVKMTLLQSESSIALKTSECSKGRKNKCNHFLKSSGSFTCKYYSYNSSWFNKSRFSQKYQNIHTGYPNLHYYKAMSHQLNNLYEVRMQFWQIPGIYRNFSITTQRSLVRTVTMTI